MYTCLLSRVCVCVYEYGPRSGDNAGAKRAILYYGVEYFISLHSTRKRARFTVFVKLISRVRARISLGNVYIYTGVERRRREINFTRDARQEKTTMFGVIHSRRHGCLVSIFVYHFSGRKLGGSCWP